MVRRSRSRPRCWAVGSGFGILALLGVALALAMPAWAQPDMPKPHPPQMPTQPSRAAPTPQAMPSEKGKADEGRKTDGAPPSLVDLLKAVTAPTAPVAPKMDGKGDSLSKEVVKADTAKEGTGQTWNTVSRAVAKEENGEKNDEKGDSEHKGDAISKAVVKEENGHKDDAKGENGHKGDATSKTLAKEENGHGHRDDAKGENGKEDNGHKNDAKGVSDHEGSHPNEADHKGTSEHKETASHPEGHKEGRGKSDADKGDAVSTAPAPAPAPKTAAPTVTPPPTAIPKAPAPTGAPVPLAPFPLPQPTATIAEAISQISASAVSPNPQGAAASTSQQGSDYSDMMRLGAPAAQAPSPSGSPSGSASATSSRSDAKHSTGSGHIDLAPVIGTFRPDEILAYGLSQQAREQLRAASVYQLAVGHAATVTRLILPDNMSASDELPKLIARYPDELFGLNYIYRSYRGAGESGPALSAPHGAGGCDAQRCYGPGMIGWHAALAACARNVVVGIIDTGLDQKHSAVSRLHLIQHPADADRRGENWHGTGVAALLGGARDSSTPGLIPEAQYIVIDAFYASKSDEPGLKGQERQTVTDSDHLIWALEILQEKRAQVVNMSLVGPSDPAIHAAIRKMARAGVVFVAAAGNGGPAAAEAFPAAYAEVIAVTAIDRNRHGYAEANHGAYIDLAAPGVRVWTALPGERQGFLSGTSFAAPFVTAIAAATYNSTPMKTAAGDRQRTLDPKDEVIARIGVEKLGASEGARDRVFGLGLVHAPSNCSPPSRLDTLTAERPAPPPRPEASKPAQALWQAQVIHASSGR